MFTIYYRENEAPSETRVGMVSAPNQAIAYRVAQTLFSNSTILGINEFSLPEKVTNFPGARFINGQFHPVSYQDEIT